MSYRDVYDFEGIIEGAIAALFAAQEIVCFTPQSDPQFQKQYPRVEVAFTPGPGRQQYLSIGDDLIWNGTNSDYAHRREAAFYGSLRLDVISAAKPLSAHSDFRSKIRMVMSNLGLQVNGFFLLNHKIQQVTDAGSSSAYEYQEGYIATTINYNLEFSINANAWQLISQPAGDPSGGGLGGGSG